MQQPGKMNQALNMDFPKRSQMGHCRKGKSHSLSCKHCAVHGESGAHLAPISPPAALREPGLGRAGAWGNSNPSSMEMEVITKPWEDAEPGTSYLFLEITSPG